MNTEDKWNSENHKISVEKPASSAVNISTILSGNNVKNIDQIGVNIKEIEKTEHVKLQVDELTENASIFLILL